MSHDLALFHSLESCTFFARSLVGISLHMLKLKFLISPLLAEHYWILLHSFFSCFFHRSLNTQTFSLSSHSISSHIYSPSHHIHNTSCHWTCTNLLHHCSVVSTPATTTYHPCPDSMYISLDNLTYWLLIILSIHLLKPFNGTLTLISLDN